MNCIHRVPVTFRMQKLDDGSQGQEIVEEPAVTETTLSPDEDPKMVKRLTWVALSREAKFSQPPPFQLSVGMFIIMAIVILIILVCIGYCVYQQCFSNKENSSANGSANGGAGNKTAYTEVPKKDEEANLT